MKYRKKRGRKNKQANKTEQNTGEPTPGGMTCMILNSRKAVCMI